jgi:hypothetical protein
MNPHIEYLKQLKAHGQTVVSIDYILSAFENANQTAVKVPQRRFDRQEHQHIIQSGWRAYEANTKRRGYNAMEEVR